MTANVETSKEELNQLGVFASILGHVGDGNFHESILYDPTDVEEKERVRKCVHDMVDRALEMEGTCSVGPFYTLKRNLWHTGLMMHLG